MNKVRVHYLDCLRVFAAFLVIATHCNFAPMDMTNKINTQILGVIGSPSSELFLAISGSLLIPVKTTEREFYKKRFTKLMPPLISAVQVIAIFSIFKAKISTDSSFTRFCKKITNYTFGIYLIHHS